MIGLYIYFLFAPEKQDANHPFSAARITPSELRFRLPRGPEGRWKLAGGRAKRTPPDHRMKTNHHPGRGGGTRAPRAPAGAHDFLDGTVRWCSALESKTSAWQSRRMSTKVLEQTVNDLQRRVTELEGRISGKVSDGWRKIVGAAKNDQYFAEAMRLGAKWRKKANREKW